MVNNNFLLLNVQSYKRLQIVHSAIVPPTNIFCTLQTLSCPQAPHIHCASWLPMCFWLPQNPSRGPPSKSTRTREAEEYLVLQKGPKLEHAPPLLGPLGRGARARSLPLGPLPRLATACGHVAASVARRDPGRRRCELVRPPPGPRRRLHRRERRRRLLLPVPAPAAERVALGRVHRPHPRDEPPAPFSSSGQPKPGKLRNAVACPYRTQNHGK